MRRVCRGRARARARAVRAPLPRTRDARTHSRARAWRTGARGVRRAPRRGARVWGAARFATARTGCVAGAQTRHETVASAGDFRHHGGAWGKQRGPAVPSRWRAPACGRRPTAQQVRSTERTCRPEHRQKRARWMCTSIDGSSRGVVVLVARRGDPMRAARSPGALSDPQRPQEPRGVFSSITCVEKESCCFGQLFV